jgi:hypothetical protein
MIGPTSMRAVRVFVEALAKLVTSFDGERVVYSKDPKRVARLYAKINHGLALDVLNFEQDKAVALEAVAGGRIRRRAVAGNKPGKAAATDREIRE